MDPVSRMRSKILSHEALCADRGRARARGRSVVQCHGCFDLVHPGHVRHLQHAAKQGDQLLVTLSADDQVAKGNGRPLIPQELRAENLAALDCVDWVSINPYETAAELLAVMRPDVYVKGREYETNEDPRFRAERDVVERSGGRVVFSSGDVVFSSTALIAAMERASDPFGARLAQLVRSHDLTAARISALVDSFASTRVCVVGECLIDTYVMCDAPEMAGEAPVMSLRPIDRTSYDGGAAIIARHLAALGARPTLVTGLPRTAQAQALRDRLEVEGVELVCVETDGPMLEKQRFLVGAQKVMKLDLVPPVTLDATRQERLRSIAIDASEGCDAAIVADFGSGLLTAGLLARVVRALRPKVGFLAGDISGRRGSLLQMEQMDLLTPTEPELRDAVRDYDDSLNAAVWRLLDLTQSRRVLVTMGGDGLAAFERRDRSASLDGWANRLRGEHVPALTMHPVDTMGCGDAALAAATLTLARAPDDSRALPTAALVASIAAGAEAQQMGNVVISAADLRQGAARLCGIGPDVTTRPTGVRLVV